MMSLGRCRGLDQLEVSCGSRDLVSANHSSPGAAVAGAGERRLLPRRRQPRLQVWRQAAQRPGDHRVVTPRRARACNIMQIFFMSTHSNNLLMKFFLKYVCKPHQICTYFNVKNQLTRCHQCLNLTLTKHYAVRAKLHKSSTYFINNISDILPCCSLLLLSIIFQSRYRICRKTIQLSPPLPDYRGYLGFINWKSNCSHLHNSA